MNLDRHTMRDSGRLGLAELLATEMSPVGLEQLRLDRLYELRAVIDSLRSEHSRAFSPAAVATHHLNRS